MAGRITMWELPATDIPLALRERGIDRVVVWATPMRMRFRRIDTREGLLLHGPAGWGETSPFWDYDSEESAVWLQAGIELATAQLPPLLRQSVPVNVTVPVCDPHTAFDRVHASGCATAKVKVADPGTTVAEDCARLEAVRAALGPQGNIRVDANGAWQVDEAVRAIGELERAAAGLEYVEQPCASVSELAELRRQVNVPIAADESVRRATDPLRVARAGAADVMVVKMQPLGGVRAAAHICADAGLPVVVSSAVDSAVGIWGAACLAASLPELPYACGLATGNLLEGDTCMPVPHPVGAVSIQRPIVDEEAIVRGSVARTDSGFSTQNHDADLCLRWRKRLAEMVAYLDAEKRHCGK